MGLAAPARAQVAYETDTIQILNDSEEDWHDVEIWVNEKYVVFVPQMKPKQLKVLNVQMRDDDQGRYFPINNKTVRINRVEAYRDGQMWDISVGLAD